MAHSDVNVLCCIWIPRFSEVVIVIRDRRILYNVVGVGVTGVNRLFNVVLMRSRVFFSFIIPYS